MNLSEKVFKKVNKSVVSIYTRKSTGRKNIYFVDPREKALVKKKYSPTGQGSGVIISSQGHIITNFHVIAGSEDILVKDYDGNEYGTAIIGLDPLTDLAVLKINKQSSAITLGNIDNIRNNQKLILFILGKAMSGAPIIIGTNQFPNPPIIAGITMKKIIINPWPVTSTLYKW